MKPFTHLHVHSHFSLLSALTKIPELISAAKEDGQKAVALTDSGNMYGAIEFYQKCLKEGLKPILGLDAYLAKRTRHDKAGRMDSKRTRLVFLAKNNVGYKNLIKLVTDSNLEGFYYKPRIDREIIEKYSEGLICISPFNFGDIPIALEATDVEKAEEFADFLKGVFKEDFYQEICHFPELDGALERKKQLIAFSNKNSIPLVASHDMYYMKMEDRDARKTLISVQSSFGARDGNFSENENYSFITQKQANDYFKDQPEALDNNNKIAESCHIEIPIGVWKFPNYIVESGRTPDDEMRFLTMEGLKRRRMELDNVVQKRIDYELEVIATKGYSNYFLAVADLLRFAREKKILTNTRGSAAGSLVSYLMGVTTVDPIALNLPFERFLNPERPSAPDIDMDFADERRDEVIEYSREKYGRDHVAQIGTFGTMLARGSVRDAARALGQELSIADSVAKLIPEGSQGFSMTIKRALEESEELLERYEQDNDAKEILDMAQKIEGCARNIGIHAAGVVISPDVLTEDTPLQFDPKGEGKLITQYNMHAVGEDGVGLLKFDFLGLKNLTIIGNTLNLIHKMYGEDLDIDHIPLEDEKTFKMLAAGETAATFQLNGDGMTRFLKELKPSNMDDINAMVALYRPGPLAFIPDYIERKYNPDKVTYIDDRFKGILERTYGILIYQDDVMLLAVDFAGFSWLDADKFRKAMGKKIPELMAEQKGKFFKGCLSVGGLTQTQTQDLWDQIETFAAYGFNKAHAASYGRVAYWTAYFKANYPVLYMASVLTADQGDVEKVSGMVQACKRMDIQILPPEVNESYADFTVIEAHEGKTPGDGDLGSIRFGLKSIKNFGDNAAKAIMRERKKAGPFTSFEDFLSRIPSKEMNKKSLEALTKCGALDNLIGRGEILSNLEEILQYNKEMTKTSIGQESLFGGLEDEVAVAPLTLTSHTQADPDEKLAWEKELLGLYISGHPLTKFKSTFEGRATDNVKMKVDTLAKHKKAEEKEREVKAHLVTLSEEDREKYLERNKPEKKKWDPKNRDNGDDIVAGIINTVKEIQTKKGDMMAFVEVEDFVGKMEVVVFPTMWKEMKEAIQEEKIVKFKGELNVRNGEVSLAANKMKELKVEKKKEEGEEE